MENLKPGVNYIEVNTTEEYARANGWPLDQVGKPRWETVWVFDGVRDEPTEEEVGPREHGLDIGDVE